MTNPDPTTTAFRLGEPWPWEDFWVALRSSFRWIPEANMLLLVEPNITEQMIEDLTGPKEVRLIARGPLVGLLVRFSGGWDWQETMLWRETGMELPAWATALNPAGRIQAEDTVRHDLVFPDRLTFQTVLVDHTTKRIAHMGAFTVSPEFTRIATREVIDRWSGGTTNAEGEAAVLDWQRRYPTIRSAIKASLARSRSGD